MKEFELLSQKGESTGGFPLSLVAYLPRVADQDMDGPILRLVAFYLNIDGAVGIRLSMLDCVFHHGHEGEGG